ncbi:MAG: extracellular solute-binding protein [Clostridiales bacterium]|jgi:putative aldouronate transport system substrate-binding protein|nr:extracellular solute-binding protein [Clostridiales bacterium]
MKKTRRFFALLMVMMLAISSSAMALELSAPGEIPLSSETITFTVGVPQNSVIEDWETNGQTLRLEKDLNVDLQFVELPSDGNELIQKVELMIMAGGEELPDIILHDLGGLANLVKYGEMGMIVPTTEYYQTQTGFIDETLALNNLNKEDLLPYVTCYDGEIYGVFAYHGFLNNSLSASRMLVYQPWLEALGLEFPKTTDEFADMLRAFKTQDPNGNGEADEIALMGEKGTLKSNLMRFLMNPFIYTQENYYLRNEDGTVGFAANQPEWKEGVKWIRSLVEEGLISELSITQDAASLTAVMNPEPEVVGCVARISATNLGATDVRRGHYTCLDPLEGPAGVKNHQWTEQVPSIAMVITANCEYPEAAFRVGDYLCSDLMSIWTRYGEEGVDWVQPGEDAVGTFETLGFEPFMQVLSTWGVVQNQWWAQIGPRILSDRVTAGQAAAPDALAYNAAYALGLNIMGEYETATPIINGLVFNEQEQEVVTELQSTINDYVVQSFSQFITGARDIETEWDAYVAEFDKMGLDAYMDAVNSCFARMYGAN